MIRSIMVGKLRPGVAPEDVEKALDAILALEPPGCLDMKLGVDAGLREGNWDFTVTTDFADAEGYRAYDLDDEHNRIRRELFASITEDTVRIQIEV
jgi:hypothetical protein